MPFKSEAQRKYLWANEPEVAHEWSHEENKMKHRKRFKKHNTSTRKKKKRFRKQEDDV